MSAVDLQPFQEETAMTRLFRFALLLALFAFAIWCLRSSGDTNDFVVTNAAVIGVTR